MRSGKSFRRWANESSFCICGGWKLFNFVQVSSFHYAVSGRMAEIGVGEKKETIFVHDIRVRSLETGTRRQTASRRTYTRPYWMRTSSDFSCSRRL